MDLKNERKHWISYDHLVFRLQFLKELLRISARILWPSTFYRCELIGTYVVASRRDVIGIYHDNKNSYPNKQMEAELLRNSERISLGKTKLLHLTHLSFYNSFMGIYFLQFSNLFAPNFVYFIFLLDQK